VKMGDKTGCKVKTEVYRWAGAAGRWILLQRSRLAQCFTVTCCSNVMESGSALPTSPSPECAAAEAARRHEEGGGGARVRALSSQAAHHFSPLPLSPLVASTPSPTVSPVGDGRIWAPLRWIRISWLWIWAFGCGRSASRGATAASGFGCGTWGRWEKHTGSSSCGPTALVALRLS